MKLQVILEKGDETLQARIEGGKYFVPTTVADDLEGVLDNLKMLIEDYQQHEGKEDKYWQKVDVSKVVFELTYDLQAFFQEHEYLNVSAVARKADMNETLLRQYANGHKHPSAEQAKRIEDVVHEIATELQAVSIYA